MAMLEEQPDAGEPLPVPRSVRHAKRPRPIRDGFRRLGEALQPAPRPGRVRRKRPLRPRELTRTSRSRIRRRERRIRFCRMRRIRRAVLRTFYFAVTSFALVLLVFWAKFAIVYGVPVFLDQGSLSGASAYVVLKSWWFGPPLFNLSEFVVPGALNQAHALANQLGRYAEIVTNPGEIVYVWHNGS